MNELDLHGYSHSEIEIEVENFVILNSTYLPVRIITGNSDKMKKLVLEVLKKHKFDYYIPPHNQGEILVTHDREGTI